MVHFTNKKLQNFGVFEFILLVAILAVVYWVTTSRPFYPPVNQLDRKEVPIGDYPESVKKEPIKNPIKENENM